MSLWVYRLFLPALAAVFFAACFEGEGSYRPLVPDYSAVVALKKPTPTPTATPTPTPTPIPAPALAADTDFAYQGGLVLVRLTNPPEGDLSVTFAGGSYPLLREADVAFAVIGLAVGFTPGDYTLSALADGETVATMTLSVAATDFPIEYLTLPPDSASLLTDSAAIAEERRTLTSVFAGFTSQRLWSGPWSLPAQGDITQPFGLLRSINGGPLFPHSGTDIAADEGVPVFAAASGRIAFAGTLYLYGNAVIIDHGAGVFSGYNHLSEITVSAGQTVAQSDLIGRIGATGLVSGPHLHWEVIIHGVRVDPILWTFSGLGP